MAAVRILLIGLALAGLAWFQFVNTASAAEVGRSALDLLDSRPATDVLFVGNSRTYSNDLPVMVRNIADSADAPVKYRMRMWAQPGARFADHVANPAAAGLLRQKWDRVILQAASGSHIDAESRAAFQRDGATLAERAARGGSPVTLIVSWNYGKIEFPGPGGAEARSAYYDRIQADHRTLAGRTGAGLIDAGGGWRRLEETHPGFPLTTDGNHPTVQGTYLAALLVYAHLSDSAIDAVRYVPEGMTEEQATRIRAVAGDFLAGSIDAAPAGLRP